MYSKYLKVHSYAVIELSNYNTPSNIVKFKNRSDGSNSTSKPKDLCDIQLNITTPQ